MRGRMVVARTGSVRPRGHCLVVGGHLVVVVVVVVVVVGRRRQSMKKGRQRESLGIKQNNYPHKVGQTWATIFANIRC